MSYKGTFHRTIELTCTTVMRDECKQHHHSHICNRFFSFSFNPAALELIKEAIAKAGYTNEVVIGMDVAASEFYRDGKYDLDFKSPDDPSRYITPDELADLYKSFVKDYPGNPLTLSLFTRYLAREEQDTLCSNNISSNIVSQR